MSRKTTALIIILVILTAGLVALALHTNNPAPTTPNTPSGTVPTASPTPPAHTTLSLSPATISLAPYTAGSVAVTMDTQDNPVTIVQLEISYDPKALTNVKVIPGTLFSANPVPIQNIVDPKTGTITYWIGLGPGASQKPFSGTGTVATISFTTAAPSSVPTAITLMKTSLVAARGIGDSVLKNKEDVKAMISVTGQAKVTTSVPAVPVTPVVSPAPTQ